jgi:hypothetical protein
MSDDERTKRIAELNDALRTTFVGGRVLITQGIAALSESEQAEIIAAVMEFEAFTPDCDPRGEHDFLAVDVLGHRVFAKVDYYDADFRFLSPDPSDPMVTRRTLTIMLAEEW